MPAVRSQSLACDITSTAPKQLITPSLASHILAIFGLPAPIHPILLGIRVQPGLWTHLYILNMTIVTSDVVDPENPDKTNMMMFNEEQLNDSTWRPERVSLSSVANKHSHILIQMYPRRRSLSLPPTIALNAAMYAA